MASQNSDFFYKSHIRGSIGRISEIIDSGIFHRQNVQHVLFKSAIIEVIITLHELLQMAANEGKCVDFSDDIDRALKINDITDLISKIRNAICHLHSKNNNLSDGVYFNFNTQVGVGIFGVINGVEIKSDYDDIRVYYGPYGLYISRQLIRAFTDVVSKLTP